ncbi:MAG: hypothetical protein KC435_02455 [Thermomicrobiales bacterium]|nr:hypothetical protein [Thermomicrobiales bacterium]
MWNPRTYRDTDYGLESDEQFEPEGLEIEVPEVSLSAPHIMTLLGPIVPEELGICLPHVHLMHQLPAKFGIDAQLTDQDAAEAEVEAFVSMNGRSLVECSTPDAGRMIAPLLEIAGWVPAHLIGVTGRNADIFASFMPNAQDRERLVEEFLADLNEGMDGTDARAGVIKVGVSSAGITDAERATIQAAAGAHRATGVPVTSHTESTAGAMEMLSLLAEGGVDSSRVIVGHVDLDERSLDEHVELARTGAYLQFDQIGKPSSYPDQMRAERIRALLDAGFGDQILLSLDYGHRSLLTGYDGSPGLSYLSEWFMVLLMEAGIDAMTIRRLVVDNPSRALTIHPPSQASTRSS